MKDNKFRSTPLPFQQQVAETPLGGSNQVYLEGLYEDWLSNPSSVEQHWQNYFAELPQVNGQSNGEMRHSEVREYFKGRSGARSTVVEGTGAASAKQISVLQYIQAWRRNGHLKADINPLHSDHDEFVEDLTLEYYGLSESDLDSVFNTGILHTATEQMSLRDIISQVNETYSGSIGSEYVHIRNTTERDWLQERIETTRATPKFTDQQRRYILDRLVSAEALERFLHTKYVGQKRFSLEGGESLIPLLDELVQQAGTAGAKELVIGMAHRGRLNVLVNILGKSPSDLFDEFEGKKELKGSGDVKYHMGFSSDMNTPGGAVHLSLAFNPSHLEIVGPVVEGSVRARQERRKDADGTQVIPVIIHGDAALAGQGVNMETLNMSRTRGFNTKGTVHIVVNNQIGFTTSQEIDARSTQYCTDVAKMVDAPVFHVNGDDPEAVVFITQLALDYRNTFKKDVLIDIVCYRRHGHNEADEPAMTQPIMYDQIRSLPTTRALYSQKLVDAGVITEAKADQLMQDSRKMLEKGHPVVPHLLPVDAAKPNPVDWDKYLGVDWDAEVNTSVSKSKLLAYAKAMMKLPDGFKVHRRVAKLYDTRLEMAKGNQPLDWGAAEVLAYASLVDEGTSIRLCGQDSGRGTFSHRHAVLHHQDNRKGYIPLRHISSDQGFMEIIDSLLSEEAVLAFEYGYSTTSPDTLDIWEAQFGDFANGAQVVMDQFISSGEQKWERLSGLVMYLPHGFEGQGPEHSSARLERYLQLCAELNMQVVVPSTPAQMFHLIRRQMLRDYLKPLIVMTPKSLLRHPLAVNELSDFSDGGFMNVIPEVDKQVKKNVTRVVVCSGKVYYDLLKARRDSEQQEQVALIRLEQIYPFPEDELGKVLDSYKNATDFVWCQEEPLNQGAWDTTRHRLHRLKDFHSVSRPAAASPAVGMLKVHNQQQQDLIEKALQLKA